MLLRFLLAFIGVVILAWFGGLIWFAASLDDPTPDPNTPVDAIVVLTGGSLRIDEGMQLLIDHKGKRLFISGVHPGIDTAKVLQLSNLAPSWVQCCITLGHASYNTTGNAAETAAWVRAHAIRSLRLVTANYHMKRSLLEFRRSLPADVVIIPNPVFPDGARPGPWLGWRGTAHVVIVEYSKYLGAEMRDFLVDAFPVLKPIFIPAGLPA